MVREHEGWEESLRDEKGRLADSTLAHLIAFELPARFGLYQIVEDFGLETIEEAQEKQTEIIFETENSFLQFSSRVLELTRESMTIDAMTGLANRQGMRLGAWRLAHGVLREHGIDLSQPQTCESIEITPVVTVLFFDLNGLKIINDLLSYRDGDKLIMKLAQLTKSSFRENDLLARRGEKSDEICVIVPLEKNEISGFMTSLLKPGIQWNPEEKIGRIPHIFYELDTYRRSFLIPRVEQEAYSQLAAQHEGDERLQLMYEGVGSVAVGIVQITLDQLVCNLKNAYEAPDDPIKQQEDFLFTLTESAEKCMKLAKQESRKTGRNYAAVDSSNGRVVLVNFEEYR